MRGRAWARRAPLLAPLVLLVCAPAAPAGEPEGFSLRKVERLLLDGVRAGAEGERMSELYMRAETSIGEPVDDLRPIDVAVRDDGEAIDPDDIVLRKLAATTRGAACVVLLDVGADVPREAFRRARDGALGFVDQLGEYDRVAVLAYADEVREVAAFDAPRAETRTRLQDLRKQPSAAVPRGRRLFDALGRALDAIRADHDLPWRAFIVAFAAGNDRASALSRDAVLARALGDEFSARVPIHGIGYSDAATGSLQDLRTLSRSSEGSFFRATSTDYLSDFFDGVWRQMMHSYVLSYPATMDGRTHEVEVRVDDQVARRRAHYPKIGGPWWPWLLGVSLAGLGGASIALRRAHTSRGRLVFTQGPRAGEGIELRRRTLHIGALPDNDIVIESAAISRYHATIHARDGEVGIEDRASRNGTFVNGRAITTSVLRPGDRVRIADVELVYER